MNSQIFWLLLLLSSFFVCSAATTHYSYAQTNQLSPEQLMAGAKRKGKLVWYATLTSADARTFLNLFEQKYPFMPDSEKSLTRYFFAEGLATSTVRNENADNKEVDVWQPFDIWQSVQKIQKHWLSFMSMFFGSRSFIAEAVPEIQIPEAFT
jgi:hypothetical protein